jgi:PhnB protein
MWRTEAHLSDQKLISEKYAKIKLIAQSPAIQQETGPFPSQNREIVSIYAARKLCRISSIRSDPMYIPAGFGTVTPYAFVDDAQRFVDFLVHGLGGSLLLRHMRPDGCIANAQVKIGTSTIMISEASAIYPAMTGSYYLFVADADAAIDQALRHGAILEMAVADMPYGDRQGGIRDVHGNIWWVSQRLIDEPYS